MTETIVSLETAKLLKRKGFNEFYALAYADEDLHLMSLNTKNSFIDELGFGYSAPSQSITAKWLRERHEINVSVLRMTERYGGAVSDSNLLKYFWHIQIPNRQSIVDAGVYYLTYEEAFEQGIKEALKHIGL